MPIIDKNQSFFNVSPKNARRQKMGEMLIENATKSEPVYGWGQGLAKLLAAGVGAYTVDRAERDTEAERNQGYGEIMGTTAADQWTNPDTGRKVGATKEENQSSILNSSDNPYTQQYRLLQKMKEMQTDNSVRVAEAKRDSIYGNGQPMSQPNGQPQPAPSANSGAYVPPNQPQLTGNPVTDEQILKSYGKKVGAQQADAPVQAKGRENLDKIFIDMSDRFEQLRQLGGTPEQGTLAAFSNTEGVDLPFGFQSFGGQDIARMRGTPEQGIRDLLKGDIGDVKTAYQKASGLTATQLNSNQEAVQFIKSLPNLMNQSTSNQQRIADMSERFSNSVAKAKLESLGRVAGGEQPLQPTTAIDQMEMPNDVLPRNTPNPALQNRPTPLAIPDFQLDKRSRLEELRRKKAGQ